MLDHLHGEHLVDSDQGDASPNDSDNPECQVSLPDPLPKHSEPNKVRRSVIGYGQTLAKEDTAQRGSNNIPDTRVPLSELRETV